MPSDTGSGTDQCNQDWLTPISSWARSQTVIASGGIESISAYVAGRRRAEIQARPSGGRYGPGIDTVSRVGGQRAGSPVA